LMMPKPVSPSPNEPSPQTAFDTEVTAMGADVNWYQTSSFRHPVIHSDSTSAVARTNRYCKVQNDRHTGPE